MISLMGVLALVWFW